MAKWICEEELSREGAARAKVLGQEHVAQSPIARQRGGRGRRG